MEKFAVILSICSVFLTGCREVGDGSSSVGLAEPSSSNVDNKDDLIPQKAEGLIWSNEDQAEEWNILRSDPKFMLAMDAESACANDPSKDYHDWRLPTSKELASAVSAKIAFAYEAQESWVDKMFWTQSSSLSMIQDYLTVINIVSGESEPRPIDSLAYVICVRGHDPDGDIRDTSIEEAPLEKDDSAYTSKSSSPPSPGTTSTATKSTTSSEPDESKASTTAKPASDTKAPDLTFSSKPAARTSNRSPAFKVTSTEKLEDIVCMIGNTALQCQYDGLYTIEMSANLLLDSSYTLKLEAKDAAGNPASISYQFVVDTTAPAISFESTVPATINNTVTGSDGTKCYTFNVGVGIESNLTLFSKLDSGDWVEKTSGTSFSVCTTPGQHTFSVKGRDDLSNESVAVSKTWTLLGKYYEQTISGDKVIRQRDTGASLYWFTPLFSQDTWSNANSGCAGLTYAGYSDWSLPSSSIASSWNDGGVKNFISNSNGAFWTSTTQGTSGATVWKYTNNFSISSNSGESQWPTTQTRYVRCVRLGN